MSFFLDLSPDLLHKALEIGQLSQVITGESEALLITRFYG